MTNIASLIKEHYIDTIDRKEPTVGVEIELPLVSIPIREPCSISFIDRLLEYIKSLGFVARKYTLDGHICELKNSDGDVCSFETTWNTLELSMENSGSLLPVANRFYTLLIPIQNFCMENGYYLCGRGINPNYKAIDMSPLNTPILLAKSKYLKEFTQHHDGEIFHSIIASVQTHLDAVNGEQYIKLYNMLRKVYAFEGLFFANSMPAADEFIAARPALDGINTDTLCFRDELWRHCGAPNIIDAAGDYADTNELCCSLTEQRLFIVPHGDGFCPIEPITLTEYFAEPEHSAEDLDCFRLLTPVALTKNGNLEIRSTCTQPLDALFEPSAFYLGLAANLQQAELQVNSIYEVFFNNRTPLEVRDQLMKASNASLRQSLKDSGAALIRIALGGLRSRSLGEEKLLLPLEERYVKDDFTPPGLFFK